MALWYSKGKPYGMTHTSSDTGLEGCRAFFLLLIAGILIASAVIGIFELICWILKQ